MHANTHTGKAEYSKKSKIQQSLSRDFEHNHTMDKTLIHTRAMYHIALHQLCTFVTKTLCMKVVGHTICQAVLMQFHIFLDMSVVICEQYIAPFLDSLHPEANEATSSLITHNYSPIKTASTPKYLTPRTNTAFKCIILDITLKIQTL
jgi:hypothetical protein